MHYSAIDWIYYCCSNPITIKNQLQTSKLNLDNSHSTSGGYFANDLSQYYFPKLLANYYSPTICPVLQNLYCLHHREYAQQYLCADHI